MSARQGGLLRGCSLLLMGGLLWVAVWAPAARASWEAVPSQPAVEAQSSVAFPCDEPLQCLRQIFVPIGQDFRIAEGNSDLFRPAAAGSLVVWYTQGTDGMDIYGLRVSPDGLVEDRPSLIVGGAGDQTMPAIAANSKASIYLLVWQSRRGNGADVYATFLSADGRPQGDPFPIVTAENDQLRPFVTYARTADAFLVVWQDSRNSVRPDVYGRLVPASATSPMGREFVIADAPGGHLIPTAACETDGAACLVVWQDDRDQTFRGTDVYGRRVDSLKGATMGGELSIAVERDFQFSPEPAWNPVSGEYLVVWNDNVSAQRVSRTGQPVGERLPISRETPYQYKPVIAVEPDGNYLIVWEDLRDTNKGSTKIYGQRVTANGQLSGDNFALSSDLHNQYSPALIYGQRTGVGAFFAVWEDARGQNGRLAVYGEWLLRGGGQ